MNNAINESTFRAFVANKWGDPESAIEASRLELFTGSTLTHNGQYYEPPIPFEFLARLRRVNPHHSPLPEWVAGQVVRYLKPHPMIKRAELRRMLIDFETTGNGFLKRFTDNAGRTTRLMYQPTINTRRAADPMRYGFITPNSREYVLFQFIDIVHFMQHDTVQQIYGMPYWLGAMQSILLGEDTRLFPRLFFKNGGSTGDMIVTSGLAPKEQEGFEDTVSKVKRSGRFLRMVFQFARGKIDDIIKVIPYSTGSDKIDFSKLANLSSDDILDAWGIRKELVGMTPDTPGGSGDLDKLNRAWYESGIIPRQQALQDLLEEFLPTGKNIEFYNYDDVNNGYKNTTNQ